MKLITIAFTFVVLVTPTAAYSQTRSAFSGHWNWAIYATDKSELPPAYQSMELKEVPQYALDLTLKQKGNKLSGSFGLLARYLARVDEGSFSGTISGSTVTLRLKSNFGGSATIRMTLRNGMLQWKRLSDKGPMYFPDNVVLRRLKPGEKPPYVADDEP